MANPYVYQPFWDFKSGKISEEIWQRRFERDKKAATTAIGKQDVVEVLVIVLLRLYTLRNQLVHGGATWVMDRGIPTEETLSAMRASAYPVRYLVGTPKGRLSKLEQAFKELKHDPGIRPIYHQTGKRIEAHIFVAFIAYSLQVTLKHQLRSQTPGLTPRAVLEKFAAIQMVDVHLPTTDGRQLVLPRYTQPGKDHQLLLQYLKPSLPAQPPPRISA